MRLMATRSCPSAGLVGRALTAQDMLLRNCLRAESVRMFSKRRQGGALRAPPGRARRPFSLDCPFTPAPCVHRVQLSSNLAIFIRSPTLAELGRGIYLCGVSPLPPVRRLFSMVWVRSWKRHGCCSGGGVTLTLHCSCGCPRTPSLSDRSAMADAGRRRRPLRCRGALLSTGG